MYGLPKKKWKLMWTLTFIKSSRDLFIDEKLYIAEALSFNLKLTQLKTCPEREMYAVEALLLWLIREKRLICTNLQKTLWKLYK